MAKYNISTENGEWVVTNARGIIIAYCGTRDEAIDVRRAQMLDDERASVMSKFNEESQARALYAEFLAEIA